MDSPRLQNKTMKKAGKVIYGNGESSSYETATNMSKNKCKETGFEPEFNRVDQLWDSAIYDPAECDRYLFSIRRAFDCEGKYKMTRVDIKSKLLKEALEDVMGGIKGVGLSEENPAIDPNVLFLYLEDLRMFLNRLESTMDTGNEATRTETKNGDKIKHVKVLLNYLDEDYAEIKQTLYPMLRKRLITFDLLWTLYKPDTIACTTTYGTLNEPRAFKIEYAAKEIPLLRGDWYKIEGKYLEYDGKTWGMGTISCDLPSFKGARAITSLSCYPIKYHKEEQKVREELIDRGKKFISTQGVRYKSYNGLAYYEKSDKIVKVHINGRVMIDPVAHRRFNPNYPVSAVRDLCESEVPSGCSRSNAPIPDATKAQRKAIPDFTEEEYLIASSVVLGFAFSEKLWLELAVSSIKDITWNDNAYESLVMEKDRKDILTALVKSHKYHPAERIDDVIQGKGKGLVALLHGTPGTGKTLTVESIAEFLKCPLYIISAGELGTNSHVLEVELKKILDISMTWGCVVLLDEADVFLEKRTIQDIHRNALTFDDAFQSRIHIALRYGELSFQAKKNIFKMFIDRVHIAKGIDHLPFTEDDFNNIARHNLNGRQIKNTVRTAQALAINKGEKLGMYHISLVLRLARAFEKDLNGGTGYEDAMRNYS